MEICIGALASRCGTTNRTSKYNQHFIGSVDLDVPDRRFDGRNLFLPFWNRRWGCASFVGLGNCSPGTGICVRITPGELDELSVSQFMASPGIEYGVHETSGIHRMFTTPVRLS